MDERIKQFLSDGSPGEPVNVLPAARAEHAAKRHDEFVVREYIEQAGAFYDDLLGFFVQQRERKGYLEDVSVGALALLTINLREAYIKPPDAEGNAKWTEEIGAKRAAHFDELCRNMQRYYNDNKDK